ncbi:AsmA-like C-terminal region-containing protein [Ferrovibrio sp.]|uniref:AsmA family protein n=1 Tax=Ferrovibrio sp. TaxID=1917215 RepID=UPI000CB7F8EC|nr:AsmA-like C-terminal region-containing protein [Ferrovibrio sp.]PJI38521.1 MAG: hypothetical protein CTR53_16705 [Ferrovibrio sp.]
MMVFRLKYLAALLAVLLVLATGAMVALLAWPRAAVQTLASHLLDRRVQIAELSVGLGDPVTLTLRGLQIANMPGGSSADMIAIEAIDATLDRPSLLRGRLVYESLQVTRPRIALERDQAGRGNWEFGSSDVSAAPSSSRLVLVPKTREQFPSLLNVRLTGGELRFRTSSGKWLRLPLDDLTIQATDEDAPVSLVLDGGYNDTDAQLTARTASFNAFRDASKPFNAGFSIATPGAKLDFKGLLHRPLDFDGVEGRLALEARRLDDLIGIFDSPAGIVAPLKLAGGLTRNGDAWRLEDARGDLGGNAFTGRIALDEGNRGEADDLQFRLDFDRLDLPTVLPQGSSDWRKANLRPSTAKDAAHLDLQISADALLYGDRSLKQVAVAVEVASGLIRLHGATANLGTPQQAGHLRLNGELRATDNDSASLNANLQLDRAEAGTLLQALGLRNGAAQIAGAVEARAALRMNGAQLGDALKTLQGHGVIAMQQGRIARSLVEAASADLRALFRDRGDSTALRCLLAAAEISNGMMVLGPLILRSDGGTIRGGGGIDLTRQHLDLVLRSDPKTTGFLALDIPLHLQGPLGDISAKPDRQAMLPRQTLPDLPPAQAVLVRANPCAQ